MPPSTGEIPTTPDEAPAESQHVIVDPGQPIRVSAWFPGAPPRFSFMAPGEEVAHHDPGFGREGSRIKSLGNDLYRFTIDTRGMQGGEGWWYFANEVDDPEKSRAKLGRFTVREHPRALVERATQVVSSTNYVVGIDALSAPYEALARVGTPKWSWWKVGFGVAVGVVVGAVL